jgi:hypothetical protein
MTFGAVKVSHDLWIVWWYSKIVCANSLDLASWGAISAWGTHWYLWQWNRRSCCAYIWCNWYLWWHWSTLVMNILGFLDWWWVESTLRVLSPACGHSLSLKGIWLRLHFSRLLNKFFCGSSVDYILRGSHWYSCSACSCGYCHTLCILSWEWLVVAHLS